MRYLLNFSYDGSSFNGYQSQTTHDTIQDKIQDALKILLKEKIIIYASGRTDRGVHAYNQYAHFDSRNEIIDVGKFLYSLNALVAPNIFFKSCRLVADNFHARFDAKSKTYVYLINYEKYDVFAKNNAFFYHYSLDFIKLREALELFKGKHNFKNFTAKEDDENDYIRTIFRVEYKEIKDNLIAIIFEGEGFMRYMVRMMVMNVLEVASNRLDISQIKRRLDTQENLKTNYKAPSLGLYLYDVQY